MSQRQVTLVGSLLAAGLFSGWTASAASAGRAATPEEELVQEALHREIYGLSGERQQLLREALRHNPDYGPAQWQLGYVRRHREWVHVDAVEGNTVAGNTVAGDAVRSGAAKEGATGDRERTSLWQDYQQRREKAKDDVTQQMSLANWCRDHGLPLQERAHLSRVLDLNPEHGAARQRLGFRQLQGLWLTEDEIQALAARRAKEDRAADKWRSELTAIRRDLLQERTARRESARVRLGQIQDVHGIPAMESIVSVSSPEGALAVVECVARLPGQEAVESLIRHAVLSDSPAVREAAAERLGDRTFEAYVPLMLAEMYTPLVSRFSVARLSNGRLGYRHAFEREGQESRQLLVLDTEYQRERRADGDGRETLLRAFLDSLSGVSQREIAVAQQNLAQATLNQRLARALNLATGQYLPADPLRWWEWWDDETDSIRQGYKQVVTRQQVQQTAVVDRPSLFSVATASPARAECFAAGTLVSTQRGAVAIETIRVGDVVLSQHVETGELAYKPVLRTTVRPAEKLLKVRVGREEFEISHGHHFWVSGEGWVKARKLTPGMELHGLQGSLPSLLLDTSTDAETYNLVVADFHTYFVGEQRVLTHDVTSPRPTTVVVPGLRVTESRVSK